MLSVISCNSRKLPLNGGIIFLEDNYSISNEEKYFVRSEILKSESEVKSILYSLPDSINVVVEKVDWDLDQVGGVSGRTESNNPPIIYIQFSKNYKNGNLDSLKMGIKSTIFHEFHHISRGWAIQDNKFEYGIDNAMVNEGLAVVFSEEYTGKTYVPNSFDEEADLWIKEIIDLPKNVSYSDWVSGTHPDGRTYIAYRSGNYLIQKAMSLSEKNILELSELSPSEIINLAGY